MKKKPASVPETPKPAAAKTERPGAARSAKPVIPPPAPVPEKTKPARAPRKPLLDVAVETVKKMLKPKPAAKKPDAIKPAPVAEEPKRSAAKKPVAEEPKVEVDATTVVRRTYTRKKKIEVPAILLEGDAPSPPPVSGPGEKFSLGATPPAQSFSGGELPESYGTKKLFLTARDPHWLYANWDLTAEQQKELNAASTDGHLILRIFAGKSKAIPPTKSMSTRNRATGSRMSNAREIPIPPNSAIIPRWANGRASPVPAAPSRRPTPPRPKATRSSPPSRLNFRSPN